MPLLNRPQRQPPRWVGDDRAHIPRWSLRAFALLLPVALAMVLAGRSDLASWRAIARLMWRYRHVPRSRTAVSSGVPADAEVYNRRISDGRGLLHADGISIGNNVDGDAVCTVVTMSRLRHPDPMDGDAVGLVKPEMAEFLGDWVSVLHAVLHTGWELLVELGEAWRQRRQNVQPRIDRGGIYPLLRALTTGFLVDLSVDTLMATMLRGLPTAYADFVAYDEVAHHAGPCSRDARRVLRALDRQIARLERAARVAPRPYRFVILSDHGQSNA
jgi:Type I phosphodiesterase / nucleotide pyrophosphatase